MLNLLSSQTSFRVGSDLCSGLQKPLFKCLYFNVLQNKTKSSFLRCKYTKKIPNLMLKKPKNQAVY